MKKRLRKKLAKLAATYRIVQVDQERSFITLDRIVNIHGGSAIYPWQVRLLRAERNRAMRIQAGRNIVVIPGWR